MISFKKRDTSLDTAVALVHLSAECVGSSSSSSRTQLRAMHLHAQQQPADVVTMATRNGGQSCCSSTLHAVVKAKENFTEAIKIFDWIYSPYYNLYSVLPRLGGQFLYLLT